MKRRAPLAIAHVIFLASGVAGLGYQIVWARLFAVGLGHEMPSVLAVVAAFFAGLAVGAWALDRRVSRSRRPGRWYAGLEIGIGAWALVTAAVVPSINEAAARAIGLDPSPLRHWALAFAVPLVTLLPATVCMGATFPAMERLVARLAGDGRTIGALYAVNTAGAVLGTLAATWWIVPALGLRAAVLLLAALNVLCAAATLIGPARGEEGRPEVAADEASAPAVGALTFLVFITGLLGIGYEVLGVRVTAQVLENTVYSFASALTVYLVGTALGAAAYHRWLRGRDFVLVLTLLLQGLALSCVAGIFVLAQSEAIYIGSQRRLGGGPAGAVAAEMLLAASVFGAPTLLMGATFSHLVQAARRRAGGVGRAVGFNTIGSALAPLVFGVLLLPAIGARWALLVIAAGYMLLVFVFESRLRRLVPLGVLLPTLVLLPADLVLVNAPRGGSVVTVREGVMAAVGVVEDPTFGRRLKVNDRFFMGGSAGNFAVRRQTHIPLMLHPDPRRVLFLGVGTGVTAGAATLHPGTSFTAVELLPEVLDLLPMFRDANELDRAEGRGRFIVADARRYVRATDARFDVIIADLFHPARDGSGALYTREHFAAVRDRLAEGGLFCQWLPLYQLDGDVLRLIIRTFLAVYPDTIAYMAHFNVDTPMLGLVGRLEGHGGYRAGWYAQRGGIDETLARALHEHLLDREIALQGCLVADAGDLAAFAGRGPLNTDDHAIVMYEAPAFAYGGGTTYGRLVELLDAREAGGAAVLAVDVDPGSVRRLDEYLGARDAYLRGMVRLAEGARDEALALILESVRRSGDFNAGYAFCLAEARRIRGEDPAEARRILEGLVEARPRDPRAARDLRGRGG